MSSSSSKNKPMTPRPPRPRWPPPFLRVAQRQPRRQTPRSKRRKQIAAEDKKKIAKEKRDSHPASVGADGKKLPLQMRLRNALNDIGAKGGIKTDFATYTATILGEPICDSALHKMAMVLDRDYEVSVTLSALKQAVGGVCELYPYNSFKDEMDALTWDGKKRLDSIATRYLGEVEDPDFANKHLAAWLTAGIARRLVHDRPIKYDIMIVLRGEEGIGKKLLS